MRYIITKDALREGWDCPFAYILAILSKTTANTALTQMVGRVLRQPYAQVSGRQALDECYVFTYDQDVNAAVQSVRRGLEEEGMADLASSVKVGNGNSPNIPLTHREIVQRRTVFRNLPAVFLPRVLHRDKAMAEGYRVLEYERDILGGLDWDSFRFTKAEVWIIDSSKTVNRTVVTVDIQETGQFSFNFTPEAIGMPDEGLGVPFLVRQLLDIIPNPWQGMRILSDAIQALRKRGIKEEQLYANRLDLLNAIKLDLQKQVDSAAEALFRQKLKEGIISLRLVASSNSELNWELSKTMEIDISDDDKPLRRKDGTQLQRSLFEVILLRDFNTLERETAWYLDPHESIYWWHRIAVNQRSYGLQGWQRHHVYPDFLVCLQDNKDGKYRMTILETKGEHLKGNDDTEYKRKFFELLNGKIQNPIRAGEMELITEPQNITFIMLMQNTLKEELDKAIGEKND